MATQKKKNFLQWKYLTMGAILGMLLCLPGCSKEDPTPPDNLDTGAYFIKECVGIPHALYPDPATILCDRELRLLQCSFYLDLYNEEGPTVLREKLEELHQKYNDRNFYGQRDADMKSYKPFYKGITNLKLSCKEWDRNGDGNLADHIIIRYKTYKEFIANSYKWPEGKEGPWREMTLSEFNRNGGDELIDCAVYFLPDRTAQDACFQRNDMYSYYFNLDITTDDGETKKATFEIQKIVAIVGQGNYYK